ncbi:hypothetical protein F5Y15DRAFT_340926 [Xylariaceae sp. FL0016]|nr:hypothetical protein F5Y15DRAFT_340926 [Xylariaceae sp. FL0016]
MSLDQLHTLPEAVQQAVLNGPALTPPPGVTPVFGDPPSRNAFGLAVATICLSLSTMALGMAGYAKIRFVKNVHLEDFSVFAGYGLTVGVSWCLYSINTASVGFYVHQWNVRVKDLAGLFYLVHIGSLLYGVGIALLKAGILLQWLRVFVPRGTKGVFYWTCHALIWFNALLYTIIILTRCASCKPYSRIWDPTVPGTRTVPRNHVDVATASCNLLSDIIILVLPQPGIWGLRLKLKKKIGIAFIFFVGIFATVSASLRVHASLRFSRSIDSTYDIADVALWAISELTCAVLVFCIPSIPKFLRDSKLSVNCSTLLSWSSYHTKGSRAPHTRSTSSGRPWEARAARYDSLCDPGYDGNDVAGPTDPESGHHWRFDARGIPLEPLRRPEAAIVRTTTIETHEESRFACNANSADALWDRYGVR